MMEMCNEPEGVEGLDEGDIMKKWKKLRSEFTQKSRDGTWYSEMHLHEPAPQRLKLPRSYYDDLPGHGPLPELLSYYSHPFSSIPAESLSEAEKFKRHWEAPNKLSAASRIGPS